MFLALSVITWLVAGGRRPGPPRPDAWRWVPGLGHLRPGVERSLAASRRWRRRSSAPALVARAAPLAVPIAAAGALAAVVLLVLAWRVRDPDRAVVAQALTALCAVAVMSAAASVAIGRGKRATGSRRSACTPRALLILAAFAVAGAAVIALR
ncbi:MAG: hypothetical protein WKG00_19960 [Polyangiaceae bacterium]